MRVNLETKIGKLWIEVKGSILMRIEFGETREVGGSEEELRLVEKVKSQLKEYLEGKRKGFDLKIEVEGSEFQKKVWQEMLRIPYGQTISYSEMAKRIRTKAVRAVGSACGANKLSIVIPCHRVVRSDGSLGGYGGGLAIKEKLLGLESSGWQKEKTRL